MRIAGSLAERVGWIYLAIFGVWLFLRLVLFDANWVFALINISTVYFFAPVFVLLPFAVWQKHTVLSVALCVPLLLFVSWYGARFLPRALTAETPSLTVMSFNTLYNNPDLDAFAETVRSASPDIIGLQEVSDQNKHFIESRIATEYPFRVLDPQAELNGVALLSRYAIDEVEILPKQTIERGLRATVLVDNQPIVIYVVHFAPPYFMTTDLNHFAEIALERFEIRNVEADYIHRATASEQLPTLVLCDCNASDGSAIYLRLTDVLRDSFVERGWGLGHTIFSPPLPLYTQRYDYILHTPELVPLNSYVGANGGSDHLPVVATFRKP